MITCCERWFKKAAIQAKISPLILQELSFVSNLGWDTESQGFLKVYVNGISLLAVVRSSSAVIPSSQEISTYRVPYKKTKLMLTD
jgi:hypothetical protein